MKKLISLLLICVICLVSCASTNKNIDDTAYKTDVKVSEISAKICEKANTSSLTRANEGWVALNIPIDLSLCEESDVYINATGSSDLFGIFKATSYENAKKLLEETEAYLTSLEENRMSEYLAEELPKIENAIAKKCGLYITFFVLEDDARNAAEAEFTEMLKP